MNWKVLATNPAPRKNGVIVVGRTLDYGDKFPRVDVKIWWTSDARDYLGPEHAGFTHWVELPPLPDLRLQAT